MPCYKPLKAFLTPSGAVFQELGRHDILGDLELPCGRCIGCRMRRASDWTLRCMHEAASWPENCYITLTYNEENLPTNGTLNHRDFQLYIKRVVKKTKKPIRYYMCGEYGESETQRPHYHACIFNHDYHDRKYIGKSKAGAKMYTSQQLEEEWAKGNITVQELNQKAASYVARYIMKKALGENSLTEYQITDPETGEITQLTPPYAQMSKGQSGLGGIGAAWFKKYGPDVYPHDYVIADGTKQRPPKYYDRLLARTSGLDHYALDQLQHARQQRAQLSAVDNTDERRRVREIVHTARVTNLKRTLK